jgi:hypothetical protein
MILDIRMTIAVDDLFDATLSTILHASMEMCGRTKRTTDGLPFRMATRAENL